MFFHLRLPSCVTVGKLVRHVCSTLALTRISSEDEAIYQCIAENSAGTNQASARLAVAQAKDLPAAPQGLTASVLSTSALQMAWSQPPAEVTDAIIGYVLHVRKIGGLRRRKIPPRFIHTRSHFKPKRCFCCVCGFRAGFFGATGSHQQRGLSARRQQPGAGHHLLSLSEGLFATWGKSAVWHGGRNNTRWR